MINETPSQGAKILGGFLVRTQAEYGSAVWRVNTVPEAGPKETVGIFAEKRRSIDRIADVGTTVTLCDSP